VGNTLLFWLVGGTSSYLSHCCQHGPSYWFTSLGLVGYLSLLAKEGVDPLFQGGTNKACLGLCGRIYVI